MKLVKPHNIHKNGVCVERVVIDGVDFGIPYHADGYRSPYLPENEIINEYVQEGVHEVFDFDISLMPYQVRNNVSSQMRFNK